MFQEKLLRAEFKKFPSAFYRKLRNQRHIRILSSVDYHMSFRERYVMNRFNYINSRNNNSLILELRFQRTIRKLGLR